MRPNRVYLLFVLLAAVSVLAYYASMLSGYGPGFPLDDAWIHQAYARNLAQNGEWAFIPGQPSAGATSMLWVLILALGYLLGLAPFIWTFSVGILLLAGLAFVAYRLLCHLLPESSHWPLLGGVLLIFEWHLVWAALSGMETLLFALLATILLTRLLTASPSDELGLRFWATNGLLIGLATLTRPEGITLLGPLLLTILLLEREREPGQALWQMLIPFALIAAAYMAFNVLISGGIWPNTFYAKQAEYAVLLGQPLWGRFIELVTLPFVGVGLLLLPGLLYWLYQQIRLRDWLPLVAAAWVFGFIFLFAMRLPLSFQHGRYIIPVMPMLFMLGIAGSAKLLQPRASRLRERILSRAWLVAAPLVLLIFWILGARAYQRDVAFIESEMVMAAEWVNENIDAGETIAAHDIGALGYFTERSIIDLAGLVSPEVIPFIRDEKAIEELLISRGADYLMTFPGWYPYLASQGELIYHGTSGESVQQGGENMAIYSWGE